jgi:Type I phosphodiesterase / nucleotide pyrophosphatase
MSDRKRQRHHSVCIAPSSDLPHRANSTLAAGFSRMIPKTTRRLEEAAHGKTAEGHARARVDRHGLPNRHSLRRWIQSTSSTYGAARSNDEARPARLNLMALASLVMGCASAPRSVVVVSIRGLGHDELVQMRPATDGFIATADARPLEPIAVAETAPEMATFETGADPAAHGIEGSYAMDQRFRTEALWEAAARSGLRVSRIGSLFTEGSGALPADVRSLPQCEQLAPGLHVELAPAASVAVGTFEHARKLVEHPSSRTRLPGLRAYAVGQNRSRPDASTAVLLDDDDDPDNGWLGVAPMGSSIGAALGRRGPAQIGTWIKVVALSDDGRVTLYVRPTYANRGHPDEFVREVEAKLGFCPGAPDIDAFRVGAIDAATLGEEIARESDYVVNSARIALAGGSDLLVVDIPRIDRVGHAFGPAPAGSDIRIKAILDTDRDLATLARAAGPGGAVIASSGYPFYASHTKIALARALQESGAHVDELKVGTVAAMVRGDADASRIVSNLADPNRGEHPLFVEPGPADWFRVRARPGYTLSASLDDPPFAASRFVGEHGYAGGMGVFLYRGPGTLAGGTTNAADVAISAARLLGIAAPRGSTGRVRVH